MDTRIFGILEACKHNSSKEECDLACKSFEDTIGNGHNFSDTIVPDSVKMNKDSLPIAKVECGEGCVKESYFIDGRVLDIYMADNGLTDDGEAVKDICEHYGIDPEDMHVVVECDEVNKGLIEHSKHYVSCGLLKRCDDQIRNCINAGIKVVKRS